jgi:hypothetical protein
VSDGRFWAFIEYGLVEDTGPHIGGRVAHRESRFLSPNPDYQIETIKLLTGYFMRHLTILDTDS